MNTLILSGKVVGVKPILSGKVVGVELRICFGQPRAPGFITATVWGGEAARASTIAAGDRVQLEGELRFVEWEAAGRRRSELKMLAHQVARIALPAPSEVA